MKTILFVCVHNSGRSQMAEAFFNSLAKSRALVAVCLESGMREVEDSGESEI